MRTVIVFLSFLLAASAVAEEFVLVPVTARDVPGANGSLWRSSLAVTNHSNHNVYVTFIEDCGLGLCTTPVVAPKTTVLIPGPVVGSYLSSTDLDSLTVQLRVQDVSRQAETWGTTIPTVRESEALVSPKIASLVDIPVTSEFRSMLRIYDFDRIDSPTMKQVRVRYYSVNPDQYPGNGPHDELLLHAVYDLVPGEYPPHLSPRMVSVPLWTIEHIQNASRVRVEVEPVSESLRFWAFVSVTNNDTQHVTIISP